MTVSELIKKGAAGLDENGIADSQNDARLFAMELLCTDYTGIIIRAKDEVPSDICEKYKQYIKRRMMHEPAQYIIGHTAFMGYDFYVEKEVLIPRQETELLVEEAIALTEEKNHIAALDMCSGTGCIGISYKLYRGSKGKMTDVTLADISPYAIALCEKNAVLNNCDCNIIKSDLFENISGKFDIILSNPPYIKTADIEELAVEVKEGEPRLALDGNLDGLSFYKRIIGVAHEYLKPDGFIVFEIGYNQYDDVRGLLENENYTDITLKKDYAGHDRVISAKLKVDFR